MGSNPKLSKKFILLLHKKSSNFAAKNKYIIPLKISNFSDPKNFKLIVQSCGKMFSQQTFVYSKPFYHYICTLVVVQLCKLSVFWKTRSPDSLVSLM